MTPALRARLWSERLKVAEQIAAAVAAEREACAKMLDDFGCSEFCGEGREEHDASCYQIIAAAIRARA